MPFAPLRPCSHPGCPRLVSSGRCRDHQRQENERRGSSASRGYGARWRKLRAWHLLHNPVCRQCGQPASEVHHIVAIAKGGEVLDPNNLASLCKSCHSRLTAQSDGGFGR
jgi:5-methylcytosine-specific restriction protein A